MGGSYENMNLVGDFSPMGSSSHFLEVKRDKCSKPPPREKMAYGQSPNKIVLEFNPIILTMDNFRQIILWFPAFTHIYHTNLPNVGKYANMDPMDSTDWFIGTLVMACYNP